MATTPCLVVGPFGGNGGQPWNDGIHKTVRRMLIRHSETIDSIQVEYDNGGEPKWSPVHGRSESGTEVEVKFDYPSEFLESVSGYFSLFTNVVVVRSLTITTNKKKYGPYGKEEGDPFSTSSKGAKIVGFHGRSGFYLDSFGVYLVPHDLISVGPFGGLGGHEFDDGAHTTIRKIEIRHSDMVNSMQIVYDDHGHEHWSDEHGTHGGGILEEVNLDFPSEHLISMSGYYSENIGAATIQSLTFYSNKKQYGPYGKEKGKPFSTSTSNGKIIGLFGKCDEFINSIGAHFVPIPLLSEEPANV